MCWYYCCICCPCRRWNTNARHDCRCCIWKIEDTVVLDLDKAEDNYGQADLPVGILPNTGEIAFLQMDGDLSPEEFDLAMEYNFKAAREIHEIMVDALKARYEGGDN